VHVCVCLFVNDLFFRQRRMACSVYQSKSPCRSHDTGLMRMLVACALASRTTGKVFLHLQCATDALSISKGVAKTEFTRA